MVLDIETTGLSKYQHKITEIAALRVENSKVVDKFETLVNPQTHIPSFVTHLTGITDFMVKDSPIIEEVMPKFMKFIRKDPFVAHSATFDHGFLSHNAIEHLNIEMQNAKFCTRKLTRRLVPQLSNYKLTTICQHFEIKNNGAHRALSDVVATHKIFKELCGIMKKQGIEKREQILNFQDSKILR